jgi:ketosteroid isomerase-like protein
MQLNEQQEEIMSNDMHDFEQFMKQREHAARAYVNGDAAPVDSISTHSLPATFFHPNGDYEQGAEQVASRYERDASYFEPGGDTGFEILQMAASDGIACWVGFQHATARLKGQPEAIPMRLRVTEIFRREGDEWKLVHRHADSPASTSNGNKR